MRTRLHAFGNAAYATPHGCKISKNVVLMLRLTAVAGAAAPKRRIIFHFVGLRD
jgi:hypothetical protein